jgi:hypothetical protein
MTEPETDQIPSDLCLRCRGRLTEMGTYEFRTGGTSGGAKLLFGEWAELGEEKLALHLRSCSRCGQVDVRRPMSFE